MVRGWWHDFITLTTLDGLDILVNMAEILYAKAHGQNSVLKPIHKAPHESELIYVAECPATIKTLINLAKAGS